VYTLPQHTEPHLACWYRRAQHTCTRSRYGTVVGGRGVRPPHSIALAVPCPALIHCVGGGSLCPAWNTPPSLFSALCTRVAPAATANVLCVFPLSLPLQPHVLRHLLVRCLQIRGIQAAVHFARSFVRQLRRDGETAPAAAALRLSDSPANACVAGSVICV
jgi:hypothetical protein